MITEIKPLVSIKLANPIVASTNGKGLWSEDVRTTRVKRIEFILQWAGNLYSNAEYCLEFEVRGYFTRRDWDTERYGLIYTDTGWIKEFREKFNKLKCVRGIVAPMSVDYTEQGMQGDNYVSMDLSLYGEQVDEFCRRNDIPFVTLIEQINYLKGNKND